MEVNEDNLSMLGWNKETLREDYGFSTELLDYLPVEDVVNNVQLSVALGRAQDRAHQHQQSTVMYETALHVMKNAKSASKVEEDRSHSLPLWDCRMPSHGDISDKMCIVVTNKR